MEVHVDGQSISVEEGALLGSVIPSLKPEYPAAVLKKTVSGDAAKESATGNIRILTTAGDISAEPAGNGSQLSVIMNAYDAAPQGLKVKWTDRQSAAFGSFKSEIIPARKSFRYESGDIILGCAGYDADKSVLVFSKSDHTADYGADETGGVIGKVIAGRSILSKWKNGDAISGVERIVSRENTSDSFITTDRSIPLEDGMTIVTKAVLRASGYPQGDGEISIAASESVEHMLIALKKGEFKVSGRSSSYICDDTFKGMHVPSELKKSRLDGTVTVRTSGKLSGGVYIYTNDIPPSPNHTIVGEIVSGIELVRLAGPDCRFKIETIPPQIDFRGLSLKDAKALAKANGVELKCDADLNDETALNERVVISQMPPNTIEILSEKSAELKTVELGKVIGIRLDTENAPRTCGIFRDVTGLKMYDIGSMPLIFKFEDVFLFDPKVPKKVTINIENTPKDEVPAFKLAMTNDSRKAAGLVGVRCSPNREFGPTSEPFEASNIIGEVIETDKLSSLKEGDKVYFREM